MLRRNIDVTVGLVNGAIGTVMLHVYQLYLIILMSLVT